MAEQSFEKALAELEETVSQLEKGGLSLHESLSLFEKGVKLARFLRGELEKAEKKIEILLKDEKGEIKTDSFRLSDDDAPASGGEEEEAVNDSSPQGENDDGLPF
jgi:exodeoxyribonuclease VII small subunit